MKRIFRRIFQKSNSEIPQTSGGTEGSEGTDGAVEEKIRNMLQKADAATLQGAKTIAAVAILYENPRDMALPDEHALATILVDQYKTSGWIPHELNIDSNTKVAARKLVYGQEIMEGAGLDTGTSNRILSEMLAGCVGSKAVKGTSAIGFSGDSVALGQTFFAVLAK